MKSLSVPVLVPVRAGLVEGAGGRVGNGHAGQQDQSDWQYEWMFS